MRGFVDSGELMQGTAVATGEGFDADLSRIFNDSGRSQSVILQPDRFVFAVCDNEVEDELASVCE